jgi:succinyl-CoA synthetase beta subunit
MLLTEAEGKDLLSRAGLTVPEGQLILSLQELQQIPQQNFIFPLFLKAQVLHGNRELQNMIRQANTYQEMLDHAADLFNTTDQYDQPIKAILIEKKIDFQSENYLALTYSTQHRSLVVNYSNHGGIGMDDRGQTLQTVPISSINEPTGFAPNQQLIEVVQKLWQVVHDNDAVLVEINPLVETDQGFICLDAKIELEDVARFRHEEWQIYQDRSMLGRPPTAIEQRAHQVSASDHRGVAGESFFEFLGGEVGVMASGGGASLLAMDALMATGVSPANYTEYSGNPSRSKVAALTEVVLSISNLKGLFVVGSNAAFTDIFETLAGLTDGLLTSDYVHKPGFAVLIRRGGPRWEEAFAMVKDRLKELPINLKLLGPDFPIVETAKVMKEMIKGKQD